jgi:hypothetical protein
MGVGEDFFRVDIRKALFTFLYGPSVQDCDETPAVPKIAGVFQNSITLYRKEDNGLIMYYIIIMTTRLTNNFQELGGR